MDRNKVGYSFLRLVPFWGLKEQKVSKEPMEFSMQLSQLYESKSINIKSQDVKLFGRALQK